MGARLLSPEALDAVLGVLEGGEAALLVAASLRGLAELLEAVDEAGLNPYMVEAVGAFEAVAAGVSLPRLVGAWAEALRASARERSSVPRVERAVSRREALRRLFLAPRRYVALPRLGGPCGVCPYGALRGGRLDPPRCRGCMLCCLACDAVEAPGVVREGLPSLYALAAEAGVDVALFACWRRLGDLEERVAEASPARVLPIHVPCAAWAEPQLVGALERCGLPARVYAGPGVCRGCPLEEAGVRASELLAKRGVGVVGPGLSELSRYAFAGYSSRRCPPEALAAALRGRGRDRRAEPLKSGEG